MEKETTTPEYYPLTANALLAACNQKNNRDPVVSFDDETMRETLLALRHRGLVMEITGAGNRVPKYSHRLSEAMNLGRREFALLCTLMLRGPQTLGELRDRSERMYSFGDLDEVQHVLDALAAREPDPLTVKLPRLPGTKEPRYAHLLSGMPDAAAETEAPVHPAAPARGGDRVSALEAEVAALRAEVAELREQFAAFRRQFE
jgi:uncharacterized protein YceH (UPF0502 family)